MSKLKINEAFLFAKENGGKVRKGELASLIWEGSPKASRANLSNLISGRSKRVDIDMIPTICKYFGVTADFLFGLSNYPTRDGEAKALKKNITDFLNEVERAKAELITKI